LDPLFPSSFYFFDLFDFVVNLPFPSSLDKNGVAYTGEVWKQEGKNAIFKIPRVNYSTAQFFLLLIEHWDTGAANPTLLASGFSPWDPKSGPRKILVYMWPIQVEAELTSTLDEGANGNKPITYSDAERVSELWPAEWGIKWTLTTEGGKDPLAPLIAAQGTWTALGSLGTDIPKTPPTQGVWDNETLVSGKRLKVENWLIQAKGKNTARGEDTADDDFWEAAAKEWEDTHVLPTTEVTSVITWDMSRYMAGLEDQFNRGGEL
jgi:hypothetical protein